jgi:phosphoribosylaminoimidazolecarboxamide formyltransferase/IMP cyclohydrolase
MDSKKIKSALVSVYNKEGLAPIVKLLDKNGIKIYSTGGTQKFIEELGIEVVPVENVTDYPSILGGRVKTLHPKIFGGILYRRELVDDEKQVIEFDIPNLDLVIVDLYPFEDTVSSGANEEEIIEKIDIGGVSLIRAAAKNFKDVVIIASKNEYPILEIILRDKAAVTSINERKMLAVHAFDNTSHYDTAIFNYFAGEETKRFKHSIKDFQVLRYGENPHQQGVFYGDLEKMFQKLNGKELSYNNLVDVDAAVSLIDEFEDTTFAILKHTNACGVATASNTKQAYLNALACDPVSAFGGVIITNTKVDEATAEELNKLFFEVLIAPDFSDEAIQILTTKKNRIILKRKPVSLSSKQYKTLLNGVIEQDKDLKMEKESDLKVVTNLAPSSADIKALLFANKIVKHTKSNTIVFATENRLIASGVGQTSRVDALRQAIEKANSFGFTVAGSAMASDAFFPFPDCVELAAEAGVKVILQPGGSIKDQDSIDACNKLGIAMVTTGVRHFKH